MKTKSIGHKIFHFPLTKIIIGLLVVVGISVVGQNFITNLLRNTTIAEDINKLIAAITIAGLSVLSYTVLFRYYEKRKISELCSGRIGRNLLLGLYLGFGIQSLTIFVIYLSGGFNVIAVNSVSYLLPALAMAISSAVVEEIIVRGIIFRIMQEKLGSYIALISSAAIFGALHLANPNSSIIAAIAIAIEAGLLLAVVYIYSGSLWLPIAIHFGWNFTQSGIYGAIVSGTTLDKSLLTTDITGPVWITGGPFGPEGSLQIILFSLVLTVVFLLLSHKQNKIVKPFWLQKKEPAD